MCQILQESISDYAWVLTGRKSLKTPQGGLVVITRSIRGGQVWEIFLQSPGKGTQIFHIALFCLFSCAEISHSLSLHARVVHV